MKPLRVVIVDDEPVARENLRLILAAVPDVVVVAECPDGDSAVDAIRDLAPDAVLLDVEMPGCDGFGVIRRLDAGRLPALIMVTAYEQYAIDAFRARALDYLVKPVDEAAVAEALRRARDSTQLETVRDLVREASAPHDILGREEPPGKLRKIALPHGQALEIVPVEEIDWIAAAGVYVEVHVGKRRYLLRDSLTGLESRLDPDRFVRVHRSSLVNLDRVRTLHPEAHGDSILVLQDGTQLRLSRRYRQRLESALRQGI